MSGSDFKAQFRALRAKRGGEWRDKTKTRAFKKSRPAKRPVDIDEAAEIATHPNNQGIEGTFPKDGPSLNGQNEILPGKIEREELDEAARLMPPPPPRPSGVSSQIGTGANEAGGNSATVEEEPDLTALEDEVVERRKDEAQDSIATGRVVPHTAVERENRDGAIPEGFFENKEAEQLARGIKPRTQKDKEKEFVEFQKEMESDLQEIAKIEAVDAEESAISKDEYEAFEQKQRLNLVGGFKEKLAEAKKARKEAEKKPKKRITMMELPEFSSDEDGSEDDDNLTNWRAKAV